MYLTEIGLIPVLLFVGIGILMAEFDIPISGKSLIKLFMFLFLFHVVFAMVLRARPYLWDPWSGL